MEQKFQELKKRLIEVSDLESAAGLLFWDQSTYMPAGGAGVRARQMAALERLSHEKFIDPTVGELLAELRPYEESLPFDSDEASLIRVSRRKYERAVKVPAEFMARLVQHTSESYHAWTTARPANDFKAVRPYLEKTLDLSRELAEFFPGYVHIADPLIDFSDYGMKALEIRNIFSRLREELVPIVEAICSQPLADDTCLRQQFPKDRQLAFACDVVKDFGFDFQRGRCDETAHPFEIRFGHGDVRITTRVQEDFLAEAIFSTLHEAGHAMYEQGINPIFDGTPAGHGTSAGVHESQSRLWENLVGRSRGFWQHYFPRLQQVFPEQLGSVSLDTFYRAINRVERTLIRTDADEVTYNLHVMIRFDLSLDMLEGNLAISDMPDAWRQRYKSDLGIEPPDDKDGVLQDVHWFHGTIGGSFQGYTLGNILNAQFYDKALAVHPEIDSEISQGKFDTLHNWLRENIYYHGSKYTSNELIQRVTGGPLNIDPYIDYLRSKFGQLYTL
ncbi:MAG: carboxypeptidase M32 [Sedimentisphaerales bacterium]|nr:carboxypeptidase M32 [Sedimentisphaerales bacterium]